MTPLTHKLITTSKADDRLLDIIDNADKFTRSDLQAAVEAVTNGLYMEALKQGQIKL